jgi:hypothetical protein
MDAIRVVIKTPHVPTSIIRGSERDVCIQAEKIIRERLHRNDAAEAEVYGTAVAACNRVREYLIGVYAELAHWINDDQAVQLSIPCLSNRS